MKKILQIITLLIIFIPMITKASEATCTYYQELKWQNSAKLVLKYKYGSPLTVESTNTVVSKFNVNDMVDSEGNISCPTIWRYTLLSGKQQYTIKWYKDEKSCNSSYYCSEQNGILKMIVSDNKEKENPNSNTHVCTYYSGEDKEYTLTWDGEKMVVNKLGSRIKNYCGPDIRSEFTANDFLNGSCPDVIDMFVDKHVGVDCKGNFIISKENIFTDNDQITTPDKSENVYDGTKTETEDRTTTTKSKLNYNSICSEKGVRDAFRIIGYVIQVCRWVAPLMLIVLGMVDFGKAAIASDEKALSNATASLIRRFVASVVIFFIPTIILAILNAIEITKGIEDKDDSQFGACTKCLFDPSEKSCPKIK